MDGNSWTGFASTSFSFDVRWVSDRKPYNNANGKGTGGNPYDAVSPSVHRTCFSSAPTPTYKHTLKCHIAKGHELNDSSHNNNGSII
ncbi:hypothetical protein ZHAS_00004442 [Anopheles sinensis]|uniref:Uncharacterized protein n=1 Tax=Anopheles sinensis TaxID=74873 RepID=A0A084VGY4_ANOSI|nr:hypothetical protein ZHAS_00004442 [Anopheles sinensis]